MHDPLAIAAERFRVPTEIDAGPGGLPGRQIWARWPRERAEIARDTLQQVLAVCPEAGLCTAEAPGLWRASVGDWSHIGSFEDAVAMLALHVSGHRANHARSESAGCSGRQ